jgi:CRP-like cAMP-binding protein
LVTAVETALERALSVRMMNKDAKPRFRRLSGGETLVREGELGTDVYLVLDGVIRVEKGGERLAEYGPGAVLGERASIEGGARTSSLVAVTDSRVAVVTNSAMDPDQLHQLAEGHRIEDQRP